MAARRRPRRDDAVVGRPAPERPRNRRLVRTLGLAGGGACVLGLLAVFVFPTRTFLDQRSSTDDAQHRLDVLREQNEVMQQRLGELDDPAEIERLAREQYNLVLPGEEAYAVLPAPLPPLDLPTIWPFGSLQPAPVTTP
jgi:cell division protein FtsB